jgi:hypothetical protein
VQTTVERPEAYISKLREYSRLPGPADDYQLQCWQKYTENTKSALATQSNSFVCEFIEADGLAALLAFLSRLNGANLVRLPKRRKKIAWNSQKTMLGLQKTLDESKKTTEGDRKIDNEEDENNKLNKIRSEDSGIRTSDQEEGSEGSKDEVSSEEESDEEEKDEKSAMLNMPPGWSWNGGDSSIHTHLIGCFKALMNNTVSSTLMPPIIHSHMNTCHFII